MKKFFKRMATSIRLWYKDGRRVRKTLAGMGVFIGLVCAVITTLNLNFTGALGWLGSTMWAANVWSIEDGNS